MTMLEDGKGKGYRAEVDDHGRLFVRANVVPHLQHHTTYHENSYVMAFDCTLQGTSETSVMIIVNDNDDKYLELHHLHISSDANVLMKTYFNGARSSGGTVVETVNLNTSSNKDSNTTQYKGGSSADLVASNGVLVNEVYLGGYDHFDDEYEGSIALAPNHTLLVTVTGASSNNVAGQLLFTMHETSTKL